MESSSSMGCTLSTEVCDDALDNDCDGKVDCEDDNCTGALGYACSPAAPDGWTVVAFKPDPAAQCPTGYEKPAKVTTKPTPIGAFCTCNCGTAPASICTKGPLNVHFGHFSCTGNQFSFNATGGCDQIGGVIGQGPMGNWDDANAKGPAVTNAACDATPSDPPPLQATKGISCAPASTGGKGCGSDSACLPRVDAAAWCIQKAGDVSCPGTAFPQRKVVYDESDVEDTRACGPCSCTSAATKCVNGKFTSFDNAQCSGTGVSLDVDGNCNDFTGDNHTHTHFKYSAEPDVKACKVTSASALNGDVVVNNPITVCCP
jgi:hypothetical protein